MCMEGINVLRERLDKLLADKKATSEEILELSRELDKLIVEFIRRNEGENHK